MKKKDYSMTASQMGHRGGRATAKAHGAKMSEWGKKGGASTLEKHGKEHFREMRKKSAGRTKA